MLVYDRIIRVSQLCITVIFFQISFDAYLPNLRNGVI